MYYDSTTNRFQFYQSGVWASLNSISGAINYIAQDPSLTSNFETNATTGWSTYANLVASATPDVSPTGVPNINFTLSTTAVSPLRGSYSAVISKDAANRQGTGVRTISFPIDSVDAGRTLYISLDYRSGGSYVSGDLQVFMTDGSVIIPVSQPNIDSGTGTFAASFTATSSLNYELILHTATTNANAWTMEFDTISVGPLMIEIISSADVVGIIDGSSAASGYLGEYQDAGQYTFTAFPTSTTWGDATSLLIPAGDWDVNVDLYSKANGSNITENHCGFSIYSGNNSTGLVQTLNWGAGGQSVGSDGGSSIEVRITISTATTYYLKVRGIYSSGTPQYVATMKIRRAR